MADHKTDPAKLPWLGRKLLFLDRPKNITLVVYAIYALCALLLLMEFVYTKHPYFGLEKIFGFYGWYGFVMCALLVICARAMRVVLIRSESYYAPGDVESEPYPEDGLDRSTIDD
ncbi:MAG: hypothetical protein GDA53_00375 [Rhodobacteraceae bacterium]|nr:hypothetical protein [Paracoccaceae bacterium]